MNAPRSLKMPQLPPPPDGLSEESQAWWTAIVKAYVLDDRELRLLRVAAESFDDYVRAHDVLVDEGATFLDSKGNPRARPECKLANDAKMLFLKSQRELNLDLGPATPQPPRRDGGR